MKTIEEWIREWGELDFACPPYARRDDPEVFARGMKFAERIRAIAAYVFDAGPEPPEEWERPKAPTPEQAEAERAEREAEIMEAAAEGIIL